MSNIRFSVVIPTCDRPELIQHSIQSVLKQTLQPEEIIVIDNGKKSAKKYIPPNSKIKFVKALTYFGVAQARNMGAVLAQSDYISFLDDDDLWQEDYLEEIHSIISESRSEIVLGALVGLETQVPIVNKSQPIISREKFIEELLIRNPGVLGSNITIRKDLLLQSKGFDGYVTPAEDKALILDLLTNTDAKIVRATDAVVLYRQNNMNKLSANTKILSGKRRFLRKYWHLMNWKCRIRTIYICIQLKKEIFLNRS